MLDGRACRLDISASKRPGGGGFGGGRGGGFGGGRGGDRGGRGGRGAPDSAGVRANRGGIANFEGKKWTF